MKTRMDRMKSAVIIALDFFKKFNGPEKEPEANKPGKE
jgi:hypothetical protein